MTRFFGALFSRYGGSLMRRGLRFFDRVRVVFRPRAELPIPPFELKTFILAEDKSWRVWMIIRAVNIELHRLYEVKNCAASMEELP
jgi:hypothetical protein